VESRARAPDAGKGLMHDPTSLPEGLPIPEDDGAAAHLPGSRLPDVALPATDGQTIHLARLPGRTVIYAYPRHRPARRRTTLRLEHDPRRTGLHPAELRLPGSSCRTSGGRGRPGLRLVDAGHALSERDGRQTSSALQRSFRRAPRPDPGDAPSDLFGGWHDAAEAADAGRRRRPDHHGLLSRVPARSECHGGPCLAQGASEAGVSRPGIVLATLRGEESRRSYAGVAQASSVSSA